MSLEPEELYSVDSDVPNLEGSILLHRFDGFLDAGSAGEVFIDHLLSEFENRIIARFDVDQLLDYRSRRPTMTYLNDHWEEYEAPELVVRLVHDQAGTPFLILTGPEPDHQWEAFAAAVRTLVERWNVRLTVGVHGIPTEAPHTRPLGITAHGTRAGLVHNEHFFLGRLEVPGNAAALLELRLGQAGHDAVGFSVHVPHYLTQSKYPTAALKLLESTAEITGLTIPQEALENAARIAEKDISEQISNSTEVIDLVQGLEQRYDAFIEASKQPSLLAESAKGLPTADELGSQFERFLAEREAGGATDS